MSQVHHSSIIEQGLRPAYLAIIVWAIILVVNRWAVTTFDAHPWSFTFIQVLAGGLTLLIIAGRGSAKGQNNAKRTLKHGYTWSIGVLRVLDVLFHVSALALISATEAEFLNQYTIFISLIFSWFILNRKPAPNEFIGILIAGAGLVWLTLEQEGGFANTAVILMIITSVYSSLQFLIVELHPESNKALGLKDRCRYTGVVLVVTSVCFFVGATLLSLLREFSPAWLQGAGMIYDWVQYTPTLETLFNPATALVAIITGIVLRAPVMYLDFLSIRLLKSENYAIILGVFGPFAILALELVAGLMGFVNTESIDSNIIMAGLLITFGSGYVMLMRIWRTNVKRIQADKDKENSY